MIERNPPRTTARSSAHAREEAVDVLIIGAGLVGLSATVLLGMHGVKALAVERLASTATHPRAGHFQLRTMEIMRSIGIEDVVRRRSEEQYPPDGGINNVESLAGRELITYSENLNEGVAELSPTIGVFIDQDALEPILRRRADEVGARLSYRVECFGLQQDGDGATASLREMDTGSQRRVRASWVIAADGGRSQTRGRLGIPMRGHGELSRSITIYFRAGADLRPLLRGRSPGITYITNPVLRGFFQLDRAGNRGLLVVNVIGDVARPEIVAAYPDAPWNRVTEGLDDRRAIDLLRAAIGVPDFPVEVRDVAVWQAQADSAERYADGRIFLAGDAAHVVPPSGGFGGNTGVQDVHNLAWKLAFVLHGHAGPELLDSYDAERRRVGELTVEQAYARYVQRVAPYLGPETAQPLVDDRTLDIGYRHESAAVVLEPGDAGAPHQDPRESRARPGSRAPHLPLTRAGQPISTLDLFGSELVLLTADDPDGAWRAAAARAGRLFGVPISVQVAGEQGLVDPNGTLGDAYGITGGGAVLVRPDGFVAWRARDRSAATGEALTDGLGSILARG